MVATAIAAVGTVGTAARADPDRAGGCYALGLALPLLPVVGQLVRLDLH